MSILSALVLFGQQVFRLVDNVPLISLKLLKRKSESHADGARVREETGVAQVEFAQAISLTTFVYLLFLFLQKVFTHPHPSVC